MTVTSEGIKQATFEWTNDRAAGQVSEMLIMQITQSAQALMADLPDLINAYSKVRLDSGELFSHIEEKYEGTELSKNQKHFAFNMSKAFVTSQLEKAKDLQEKLGKMFDHLEQFGIYEKLDEFQAS